ncbi:hypothetical protein A1O3_06506 [Capronia epimyces CBS 606.96]|uniref:holo-[acyl-carrier-protein] synthase n=1 Tax=Capronia epimyces CBS 606.96 TaxID=1182542 RepID=W9XQ60_9EURO|nr:uncharacterized protein A1O3_06506 [Capronia epimyces CBS 606.96]EXJ82692.1 hypothetical protein A1O3_06506 [Capronia epimyces CBS 606.96]
MSSQPHPKYMATIDRYYIDTRSLVPALSKAEPSPPLPLLSTLQFSDQEAVTRFIRPADRFMSLASALLKYTFIHRRAKVPWSHVQISRTPHPHRRPYWAPTEDWEPPEEDTGRIGGLEFNVSHQAGLVAIVGCGIPTAQLPTLDAHHIPPSDSSTLVGSFDGLDLTGHHTLSLAPGEVRLGVDIACTNEDKRTPQDITSQAKFDEWVDIFAEMFSDRERWNMRHAPIHVPVVEHEEGDYWDSDSSSADTANGEATLVSLKLRRFYAYWALKEAYIKMVGEGLLANWLRELEFLNVVAPASPVNHQNRHHNPNSSRALSPSPNKPPHVQHNNRPHVDVMKWTSPERAERGTTTLLYGRRVEDVDVELVAYDEDFILATAMRGVKEPEPGDRPGDRARWKRWVRLDIEEDIRPCAEGRCRCLGQPPGPTIQAMARKGDK